MKPKSVAELVTAEIRRAIVSGTLKPGQEFSLREAADDLGVSTAPVREALRVLQGEGLVIVQRAKSAVIAPMDLDDLKSIYELRRLLEPAIAARAVAKIHDDDLRSAERAVESFRDARLGVDEIYEMHREFHLSLLRPAATPWEMRVLETLWHAAERYVRVGFGRLDPHPEEHTRRAEAHEDVLSAFRSRRVDAVRQALLDHLDRNEALARSTLAAFR